MLQDFKQNKIIFYHVYSTRIQGMTEYTFFTIGRSRIFDMKKFNLWQIPKADCWEITDSNFPKYEMKVLDGTVQEY